jgi:RNA 2',3'-cyclic 3'-phosphodiesterase
MKRIFAAIKVIPDPNLIKVYDELKNLLRGEKITWVDENNIHITLKFFGDTPEEKIPLIINILDEISRKHQLFTIGLENTGIFGSSYNPRVVWFGMSHDNELQALAEDILDVLHRNGFPRDSQNYMPHLTIGRVKYLQNKKRFQQTIDTFKNIYIQKVTAGHFDLIESRLTPKGPIYTTIRRFDLHFKG